MQFHPNPWALRLRSHAALTNADHAVIDGLMSDRHLFGEQEIFVEHGTERHMVPVIVDGFACRVHTLADGQRQVVACLLPGDAVDATCFEFPKHEDSLIAIVATTVSFVPCTAIADLFHTSETLCRALLRANHADAALLRAWIVGLGRRSAAGRLAHLICELYSRLLRIGGVSDHQFELPLTNRMLADVLGLTPVHVSRTIQAMQQANLIRLHRNIVQILDWPRLQEVAGFDPAILHNQNVQGQ